MSRNQSYQKTALWRLALMATIIVLLNILSSSYFKRIDLTEDKRFTLDDSTRQLLLDLDDVVFVKVYLKGEMPAGFKRLSNSTKELLDEMKAYGGDRIQYQFEDPTENKSEGDLTAFMKELAEKGLQPTNVQNKADDQYSEQIVVPGALVYYKGKEAAINLLENTPGLGAQNVLNNSIARLEHQFAGAIEQLILIRKPLLGFLRGHGEYDNYDLADFTTSLADFYELQVVVPENVIAIPKEIKVLVVARPTQALMEKDKFKIDQYIMNGGRVLWLLDILNAELDSVLSRGEFITTDYPTNLREDQLFRYGVRLNPDLVLDLQCNPVPLLASMEGQEPSFRPFPCYYFPVFTPDPIHAINENIAAITSKFCGSIDTLKLNSVKKTVLLHSSDKSRRVYTPWLVDFRELRNRPNEKDYNTKDLITAVLLEGTFPSVFKNRPPSDAMLGIMRDSLNLEFRDQSVSTKMIVLSDATIARNEFNSGGQPYPLGYYHWTKEYFDNKNFLLNCIDYLAGYDHHLSTRSKTVKLRLLDENKVKDERVKWQFVNMIVPIAALSFFGLIFTFIRRRKFAT